MLEEGDMEVEEIQLYFEVVKAAKEYLVERFKIVKYLYFDYIHLVKRSLVDSKLGERAGSNLDPPNVNFEMHPLCYLESIFVR